MHICALVHPASDILLTRSSVMEVPFVRREILRKPAFEHFLMQSYRIGERVGSPPQKMALPGTMAVCSVKANTWLSM
jgi:hypothetical protein